VNTFSDFYWQTNLYVVDSKNYQVIIFYKQIKKNFGNSKTTLLLAVALLDFQTHWNKTQIFIAFQE
jgi:hypothetical protein